MTYWYAFKLGSFVIGCSFVLGCGDSCPGTLDAYCKAQSAPCPRTWAAAQDMKSWGCSNNVSLSTCTNVKVATLMGVDSGTKYYYSPSSGELYRVEAYTANGGGSDSCVAGSGDLETCDDAHPQSPAACPP